MPLKKKPVITVGRLKKKLDSVFSLYIRHRDGRYTHERGWESLCITCQCWIPLRQAQAGHFQSRRHSIIRFDEFNVNAQCSTCNLWNQGEQYRYAIELDLKYGKGTAKRLSETRGPKKFTTHELLQLIDFYTDETKRYLAIGT